MIGILCEKPSAARNFAKALGGMQGSYNGEQYVIVAARGHLYEFVDPAKQVAAANVARYKSWDVSALPWDPRDFQWKRESKKDTATTIGQIKSTLSRCDEVCVATDVDPTGEGTLLAVEIFEEANICAKKWSRMYFMDEAPASIQKAFKTRKTFPSMQQDPDYIKALYRSRWDFMSMQWTRIATKFGNGKAVLRQGRLKSAMVKITGDGLVALANYKPIPFFQNRFKDENGVVYTDKDEPTFPDKTQVPKTYVSSAVILDSKEMKHTAPPRLLDLATLSSRLAGKGIKAKTVLDTYQKMYEAQVVSYPRTEDKVITPEQFNELLPKVDAIARVVGVDPAILTHRTPRSTHVKTGGAHGANRPGSNVPKSIDEIEKNFGKIGVEIYTMLALNYLATLAEDYEYESQKAHLQKYPKFLGTASVPKKMGWKVVFNDDADAVEDENAKGVGTLAAPFVYEGVNPKPPTPTMKWLMKQLEKHDVGTGATRTSIYADVTNEKATYPLLKETRGKLSMTEFGEMSYQLLPDTHIGDLQITEQLMADMRDIADGKKNPDACLQAIAQLIRDDIAIMERNGIKMRQSLGVSMASVDQKEKYEGTWNGKTVSFSRIYSGYRFTDDECRDLCAGKDICIMGVQGSNGTYNVKGHLEEQTYKGKNFIGFKRTGYINDDGSDKVAATSSSSGDSEYVTGKLRGKDVRFKRTWSGHTFTDDEIADLLAGKQISFEATAKSGNLYTAKGKLATQTYNGRKFVGFKPDFS